MNLLIDDWIPVSPQAGGKSTQISLQTLLCGDESWELSLPRDDLELAALQLLICLTQVLIPPKDRKQWLVRIANPLDPVELNKVKSGYIDWFQLDHPKYPFMQVKGVVAKESTPMDKLFPGLDSSTNSRFVNEPELARSLCASCTVISLFNQANNAPSFGGGFKFGIRGSCPVSTFAQGPDLRTSVWLNVLSEETLNVNKPGWRERPEQSPTWVSPIMEKSTVPAEGIGLLRGLFWQPGCIELNRETSLGQCSCCGIEGKRLWTDFYKAKFNFTVDGFWNHPHSPLAITLKGGKPETRHVGFTQSVPAWTQLSRYIVKREIDTVAKGEKGQKPAMVIGQLQKYLPAHSGKLELLVGGYRNNQAAIVERRHEVLTISQGWETHSSVVHELVTHGMSYKTALRKVLFTCSQGIKAKERKLKGTGLDLYEIGESQFYRRSEDLMMRALANIDFDDPLPTFNQLDKSLTQICNSLFTELTSPYVHDAELFRTLAIARRSLQKHLKDIRKHQPQEDAA